MVEGTRNPEPSAAGGGIPATDVIFRHKQVAASDSDRSLATVAISVSIRTTMSSDQRYFRWVETDRWAAGLTLTVLNPMPLDLRSSRSRAIAAPPL